jgi:hypothetical protein
VAGDLLVGGDLRHLAVMGNVTADVHIAGSVRSVAIAGSLGGPGDVLAVVGDLHSVGIGTRREPGAVWADVAVGRDLARFRAGPIHSTITVAGDLRSLLTTSEVVPGVGDTDFIFANDSSEPDGELIVAGQIGRVEWQRRRG